MSVPTKFTISLFTTENIDLRCMKTAKQDCILFFLPFSFYRLFAASLMYYHLQSCWFFGTCISRLFLKDPACLSLEIKNRKTMTLVTEKKRKKKSPHKGLICPGKHVLIAI